MKNNFVFFCLLSRSFSLLLSTLLFSLNSLDLSGLSLSLSLSQSLSGWLNVNIIGDLCLSL